MLQSQLLEGASLCRRLLQEQDGTLVVSPAWVWVMRLPWPWFPYCSLVELICIFSMENMNSDPLNAFAVGILSFCFLCFCFYTRYNFKSSRNFSDFVGNLSHFPMTIDLPSPVLGSCAPRPPLLYRGWVCTCCRGGQASLLLFRYVSTGVKVG